MQDSHLNGGKTKSKTINFNKLDCTFSLFILEKSKQFNFQKFASHKLLNLLLVMLLLQLQKFFYRFEILKIKKKTTARIFKRGNHERSNENTKS